jgi:hypothetical protein
MLKEIAITRLKKITITQVSNGYVIEEPGGRESASETLAVFNELENLAEWLGEHFTFPEPKEGGAA